MSCSEWKTVKLGDLIDSISIKHKFDKDEQVYLAAIVKAENQLICSNCWDRINLELNSDKK